MAFDRRSGRPIACDMVRVDANSVSVEVLSEERYIGSVVQEAKPPKQKNVRVTVVPTKSDNDIILCLQLLSMTLTCTRH